MDRKYMYVYIYVFIYIYVYIALSIIKYEVTASSQLMVHKDLKVEGDG